MIEKVFHDELSLISDEQLKMFVISVFNRFMPDYFMTAPASMSGNYHPEFTTGQGGLIKHVKYAIWWSTRLFSRYQIELNTEVADIVIASLLLHDLRKFGDDLKIYTDSSTEHKKINRNHGMVLGDEVYEWAINKGNISRAEAWTIMGIRYHMGIWTDGIKKNDPILEHPVNQLVSLSDYLASQRIEPILKELA